MEHIAGSEKRNQNLRLRNWDFEFPHYAVDGVRDRNMTKPDFNSLESMIEQDVRRFHRRAKNEITIIYNLSQEVFYKHNEDNPELAELAASLFLFFSDIIYYINIEERKLVPAIHKLLRDNGYSEICHSDEKPGIRELIREIRLEHDAAIKKLIYFKTLTKGYMAPVSACKSYRLLFAKLKEFGNDLAEYVHFENRRFFPLAIELELYFKKI